MIQGHIWIWSLAFFSFTRWICHFCFCQFTDHTSIICCSRSFSSAITSKRRTLLQATILTFPSLGKISLFWNLRHEKDCILNSLFFLICFETYYCKDDVSFFTFIIKIYCGKFDKYKKALNSHRYSRVLCEILGEQWIPQLHGRIYQMAKRQLDNVANYWIRFGSREGQGGGGWWCWYKVGEKNHTW